MIIYNRLEIRDRMVTEFITIQEITALIDRQKSAFYLVMSSAGNVLGYVSDREIRDALLRDLPPSESISKITNRNIFISQAPLPAEPEIVSVQIDSKNEPVEARIAAPPAAAAVNRAVVMAGGLGSRMGALTEATPKPLIPVAGRALIEHVLLHLSKNGVMNVHIAVNYLGDKIEGHVGCGARYGVAANFIREDRRLGTAGALSLLDPVPSDPFFVINADIITKLNLRAMARAHAEAGAMVTVAVAPHVLECPYGVTRLAGSRIIDIIEKPRTRNWINAGIYILSPPVVANVPRNTYIDMTTMIQGLIARGENVQAFPVREYWHDTGTPEDLQKASADLSKRQPGA